MFINAVYNYTKFKKLLFLLVSLFVLNACSDNPSDQTETEKNRIIMGFGPSTYVDQFEYGIKPLLEAQGYTIDIKIFSQNNMLASALQANEIDANVYSSTAYMQELNQQLGTDFMVLADTASAPQSVRSTKHTSLEDVRDGMTVAIPNDPVNLERAAYILEDLGWVTISSKVETHNFHLDQVTPNRVNLKLLEMDSAQMLRALSDVDFAIVNGNYIANAKQKISDGLYVENTPEQHVVKVIIRSVNQNKQWVKDLKGAYESEDFEQYIRSMPLYLGFIFPEAWSER